MLFFFFQAEDGIRDKLVTGVQTCALPISRASVRRSDARCRRPRPLGAVRAAAGATCPATRRGRRRSAGTCLRAVSGAARSGGGRGNPGGPLLYRGAPAGREGRVIVGVLAPPA